MFTRDRRKTFLLVERMKSGMGLRGGSVEKKSVDDV